MATEKKEEKKVPFNISVGENWSTERDHHHPLLFLNFERARHLLLAAHTVDTHRKKKILRLSGHELVAASIEKTCRITCNFQVKIFFFFWLHFFVEKRPVLERETDQSGPSRRRPGQRLLCFFLPPVNRTLSLVWCSRRWWRWWCTVG